MTVIELTICFEINTTKSREYKIKQYKDLKSQLLKPVSKFTVLFLEITSLGFISNQSYNPFAKYLKSVGVNNDHAIVKFGNRYLGIILYIMQKKLILD